MNNIGLIYDVIGGVIILISVIIGFSRGFFKNLICLFGNLAAFAVSLVFGSYVAKTIYATFLERILYKKINLFVQSLMQQGISSVEDYLKSLPNYVENISGILGISSEKMVNDAAIASVEKSLMVNLVEPAVVLLLSIVLFFVAFFVLKLVVRGIGNLFGHVNEIPILGLVNRLAGGLLGLFGGVIYLYIFVMFLKMVIMFTGGEIEFLSLDAVNRSRLVSLFFYFKFR